MENNNDLKELAYIFAGVQASGAYGDLRERFKGKSFDEVMEFFDSEGKKIRERIESLTEKDWEEINSHEGIPELKFTIFGQK